MNMAMAMPADVEGKMCMDCHDQKGDEDIRLMCKKHFICHKCWGKREDSLEFKGMRLKCQKCHPEVFQTQPPKVWIYVDDSNLWIEGKKAYAKAHKLLTSEDPRARFDFGQLYEVVAEGREVGGGTIYGSEPPPVDTVWAKMEEHRWKVNTKEKNPYTRKEKQVDVQLGADVVDLLGQMKNGTVIIVSGDSDYIPAIDKALDRDGRSRSGHGKKLCLPKSEMMTEREKAFV